MRIDPYLDLVAFRMPKRGLANRRVTSSRPILQVPQPLDEGSIGTRAAPWLAR